MGNLVTAGDHDGIWYRLLNKYAKSEPTFVCPSDSSKSSAKWDSSGGTWNESTSAAGGAYYFPLSYGINHNMDSKMQGTVKYPSQTGMLFECTAILSYESTTWEPRTLVRDAARHGERFNSAMADGHVDSFVKASYVQFNLDNTL
jgi:prepilin-type processing-associated H-X9-DG protein